MTTETPMWAPDDTATADSPRAPERPRDTDAERTLVATAIMQPAAIDELGAEGFDPADITTDWLRWTWHAVEELRTHFRDGELRHLAVHRQLETWHADGRMPTRVPAADQLMELCNHAHYGAAITAKIPTLIESLEMSRGDLSDRILCAEARIPLHHLRQGVVSDSDLARAAARVQVAIASAPLYINDGALLSLATLRARVRNLVRTKGLRLVIVDYLQLMQVARADNRQQAVADLSRGLKLLAKDFGIAVVVLCQLNRGPEQRTEKKPQVSDLRESGAIEQDADIVILLHREDAYDKESPRAGEADLIVGKHRNGPTATITAAFQGHYARFTDMAQT